MEPRTAVYTVKEAATLLKVSTDTLYAALERGEIPARKILGQWRIPVSALHGWLAGRDTWPSTSPVSTISARR